MSSSSSRAATGRPLLNWRERIEYSMKEGRKARGGNFVQLATVDPDRNPRVRTVVFRGFEKLESSAEALKMITDARSEKAQHLAQNPKGELLWWFPQTNEQYRIFGKCELYGGGSTNGTRNSQLVDAQWKTTSDSTREQFFWPCPGAAFEGETAVRIAGSSSKEGGGKGQHHKGPAVYSRSRKYDFVKLREKGAVGREGAAAAEVGDERSPALEQENSTAAGNAKEGTRLDAAEPDAPKHIVPQGGRDAESGEILPVPDNFLVLCLFPEEVKYLRLGDNFATKDSLTESGEWEVLRVNP
eukprot:g6062.t1